MQIAALSCKAGNPSVVGSMHTTFADIACNGEEQEARDIALPLTLQAGELALIIPGLRYTVERAGNLEVVTNKDWQPLDIIDAAYLPA